MWKRFLVSFMLACVLAFSGSIAGATPMVSVPDVEVSEGTATVQIPVNIDDATGVGGFQFTVIYDNDVLNATGAVAGSLTAGWTLMPNITNPGELRVAGLDGTLQGLPGGTGSLVLLNFNVVGGAGDSTPLTMTDAQLNDTMANPLARTVENGSLEIVPIKILTMAVSPAGGGTTTPAVGPHEYDNGTVVDLSANAAAGYRFVNWTGDVADANAANTTVTMDADKTVTANFVRRYTLTMAVFPVGGGSTVPAVGQHVFDEGEEFEILALESDGYRFENWTGDVYDPGFAETVVMMDADKTVTANFVRQRTLTMAAEPAEGGATTPEVGQYVYDNGTVVDISATANTGYRFVNWTGDVADANAADTTVTMDSDKTVTANFVRQYILTMEAEPTEGGTTIPAAGQHAYDEGTVVDISANAMPGWVFDIWIGDAADANAANTTVTMNADKVATANFIEKGFELELDTYEAEVIQDDDGDKSAEVLLGIQYIGGFSDAVNLSAAVEPATDDITVAFAPNTVTAPDDESLIVITASGNMRPGVYIITVTGQSGALIRTVEIEFTVKTFVYIPSPVYAVGDTAEVSVDITNSLGLAGFQLLLSFDPSVLEVMGVVPGGLVADWTMISNTTVQGEVNIAALEDSAQELGGESGTLFVIEVDIIGTVPYEGLPVVFEFIELTDSFANIIPSATEDGLILGGTPGDINGDGVVNIADVILCLRMAIGLPVMIDGITYESPYPAWMIQVADMNGDGVVNIGDVILILRIAVGLD